MIGVILLLVSNDDCDGRMKAVGNEAYNTIIIAYYHNLQTVKDTT